MHAVGSHILTNSDASDNASEVENALRLKLACMVVRWH